MYECSLDGKARKTRQTRLSILRCFLVTWRHGFDVQISKITPLMLRLWLSSQRSRLRAVSFNEYVRFVRQLFGLALEARAIPQSPAAGLMGEQVDLTRREILFVRRKTQVAYAVPLFPQAEAVGAWTFWEIVPGTNYRRAVLIWRKHSRAR